MSDIDTDAHHLSSDASKRKTDSYVRQQQECPPTCDTRLTGGTRVAVKPLAPASNGALRADYPSVVVIAHFQGMTLDATSCDGGSVHPPVTPV